MSMINCPECGKEISDKAKSCPNCGYILHNMKKKKFVVSIIIFMIIIMLVAIGFFLQQTNKKQNENINAISKSIENMKNGKIPTQKEYNEIADKYKKLNNDQKKTIKNTNVFEQFGKFDLNKMNAVSTQINDIDDNIPFSDIISIKKKYDQLLKEEQKYINYDKVDSAMQLSDIEKAALAAAKNVRECMKSKDNFLAKKIIVKDDLDKMNFYWVLIEYSGTNSFGVPIDSTSCFGIASDFTDPFFSMAQLTGAQKYLDSTTSYSEFTKCNQEQVEVDISKISYYLLQE